MISGIGSTGAAAGMTQGIRHGHRPRPDPSQLANDLFSKLDTKGQGFLQQADLETAFSNAAAAGGSSATDKAGADAVFKALDSNGDGKLTKQEMTDSVKNIFSQIDGARGHQRIGGDSDGDGDGSRGSASSVGGAAKAGLTKDQLTSAANALSSSDSKLASLMSSLASNFSAADTNGDGQVSAAEARAYAQSQQTTAAPAASGTSGNPTSSSNGGESDHKLMHQIMQLAHAYSGSSTVSAGTTVSATA